MNTINSILLHSTIILHVLFWVYILFGGLISQEQNTIIIFYIIPCTYIVHMFSFHILNEIKYNLVSKSDDTDEVNKVINMKDINKLSDDDKFNICQNGFMSDNKISDTVKKMVNSYAIPKYFEIYKRKFKNSFQNPLSAQGMLILGYIINIYLLKYYNKNK